MDERRFIHKRNIMKHEIAPFVKWVGGKRQLIEEIKKECLIHSINILNHLLVVVHFL